MSSGHRALNATAPLTISGVTIDGFGPVIGTGGAITSTAGLTLTDSIITNNSSDDGGAVYAGAALTIQNCTLAGNYATYHGGAVNSHGPLSISNSLFTKNSAAYSILSSYSGGGAVYAADSTAVIGGSSTATAAHIRQRPTSMTAAAARSWSRMRR